MTFSVETGADTSAAKSGNAYLKITPASTQSAYFSTVTLPLSDIPPQTLTNYSLSFDYAPSKGQNNNSNTDFGLAVHGQDGKALFTFLYQQRSDATTLLRTGTYSSRVQWALLDDFSFTGTTIYKDKFTKSLDCTFDSENDDTSVLANGFVASVLLETEAKVGEGANWT